MRIWNEYEADVYKYYEWFAERAKEDNIKAEMSVCSINASGINSVNIAKFIDICTKQIKKLFISDVLNSYKVYMFANIEIRNPNSRVEQYMKVWKSIAKSYDIEGFIIGEEMINKSGDLLFYTSIAEIPQTCLEKSIKIVISNPDRYALFISKSEKVLFKEYVQHMFENIVLMDNYGAIDYYKFLLACYRDGDIALRYGTTFTEAELAFVYNPQEIDI
jgi:hypothetical protein